MESKPEEAKLMNLEITNEQKKTLTPQDQSECIRAFRNYDKNNDGTMDQTEFKNIMIDIGYRKISDDKTKSLLAEQDQNADGVLSFSEFVDMMAKMKATDDGKFGTITGSSATIENKHGGTHTYSLEEVATFARMINYMLKADEDCKDRIPISPEGDSLFHAFDNGILLCKILIAIDPECIDSRALNRQQNMNVYQVKENLQMGIAAAKGLGIRVIGIDSRDFIEKTPHMILGVVWQVIRMYVTKSIELKDTPEIMRLAEENEDLTDLVKLTPEVILIRWVNFHLKAANQEKRIKNLGKDLSDSEALFYVLNQLDGSKCTLDGIDDADLVSRADKMITNSLALGVPDLVSATDITSGNVKVNTLFVSQIFNTKHGLEELTKEEYDAAAFLDDDVEGTKEVRAFRIWMNSLEIEDVYVNDLLEECYDGLILARVMHKINDKVIDWKKISLAPKNDFDRNINNNTVVQGGKDMKLKLVGIGGVDITKKNRKLTLALIWQLVRAHYITLIGGKTDAQLCEWGNSMVKEKVPPIANLKDKTMDSRFIIHICAAIEPRAVNWEYVLEGTTDDDKKNNAKYAISIARKLGAIIFCVWEDLVTGSDKSINEKQIFILFSVLNNIANEQKKE